MKYHAGILDGVPRWDPVEVPVLAFTMGIPIEWLLVCLPGRVRDRLKRVRAMIDGADLAEVQRLAAQNAESIEVGDGLAMLRVLPPDYEGPVSLWSQLELSTGRVLLKDLAAELGVHQSKVSRWKRNSTFDPLTGVRVRPGRGRVL